MTITWESPVTEVVWESQTAPGITWTTVVGGTSSGGGVTVHNDLSGRSAADAHPMSAITDLEPALTDIATAVQAQQGDIGTLQTDVAGKQAADADLTAIAALAPADDALIQRKAGAWTSRTPAQVKADMSIGVGDVSGLDENTRDVIGTALVAGSGVAVTVDDPGNTITIAVSGVVADAINDGTTTVAPSQNAVFDALASKANSANPTLTGTVTVPDASFSLAKLANISTARILGRRTAGTGPPEEITIAQMKTDLGVPTSFFNGLIRPYQTGYFYGPERQVAGTSSFATGFIRLTPYIPPATGTFDRIGLVTTATTSGKARFGIYDSDHATIPGAPKTLITGSDSAEIDTSAATADRLSTISVTLTGGHLYWLASAFNATTAAHHITRTAMAASDNWGIQGNLSNANGPEAYYMSNAYGAMPSTVSSLVTIVMTTAMPAVFLRAA